MSVKRFFFLIYYAALPVEGTAICLPVCTMPAVNYTKNFGKLED